MVIRKQGLKSSQPFATGFILNAQTNLCFSAINAISPQAHAIALHRFIKTLIFITKTNTITLIPCIPGHSISTLDKQYLVQRENKKIT